MSLPDPEPVDNIERLTPPSPWYPSDYERFLAIVAADDIVNFAGYDEVERVAPSE